MVTLFVSEAVPHAGRVAAVTGGGWKSHLGFNRRRRIQKFDVEHPEAADRISGTTSDI